LYQPRNIDIKLAGWARQQARSPLIIRGARQVGKSSSVENLASTLFSSCATLDFEAYPSLATIFEPDLDPKRIVRDLEAFIGMHIIPGKTLLFMDEIQECPKAISSLRYFKEKFPELHVIAAGSLLEFALGDISFPVGRVDYLYMHPLTFEEFLRATKREILAQVIPEFRAPPELFPSGPVCHKLFDALREYLIVGGMPEAVVTYAASNSFLEVAKVHDKLLRSFRDDIPKYASGDLQKNNLLHVFNSLALGIGREVTYTKLYDDDPKRTKISVYLLQKAMLVNLVHSVSPSGLPLGASRDDKRFKPIFIDIGLMQRAAGRTAQDVIKSIDLVAAFKGQIAEQFVGQELIARERITGDGELYFWRRSEKSSTAEVDYLIVRDGEIIPVEVKSGTSGSLKSLHLLLKIYQNVTHSVCLQVRYDTSRIGGVIFMPLFVKL